MQVKKVIRYLPEPLLEPLLEFLSALEHLAETLLERPFHRRNPFQRTLLADPSSVGTPSSTFLAPSERPFQRPSTDLLASPPPPPQGLFCLKP